MNEKRVLFIKDFTRDEDAGTRRTWSEYGEIYGEHPEKLRKWIRIHREKTSAPVGVTTLMRPRRMWEQQKKDGTVVQLKSYQYDEELSDLMMLRDSIAQSLPEIISQDTLVPTSIVQEKLGEKRALFIYTADKHIGVDSKTALYNKEYSEKILHERMEQVVGMAVYYASMFGKFDLVCLVDLGDGLDGLNAKTTRGDHSLEQNMNSVEQYEAYVRIHKAIIDSLVANNVSNKYSYIVAANDNHGGFGMYVAARTVQEYIRLKYPENFESSVNSRFMFHYEYGIHRFIFTHGKDEKYMKYPFPKVMNKATEDMINDYIDYHGLSKHVGFNQERSCVHLIKGDTHVSAEEYCRRFRYKSIMSMFGGSPWSEHNFGVGYKGFEAEIVHMDSPVILQAKNFFV